MTLRTFHKMHGLGNDFVIFDARQTPLSLNDEQVRFLADRHMGIGCDQLIVLEASDTLDAVMRIYNHDGSQVGACGNATRCVAALLNKDKSRVETQAGILELSLSEGHASVAMTAPRFDWQAIPLAQPMDTAHMPLAWDQLEHPLAVNVGNPHIVFFVDDITAIDLATLGPVIEVDPIFPQRVNVNVAEIREDNINLHVWERGVGLTKACGTGACATAIAAIRGKRLHSPVTVNLPGGSLSIAWDGADHLVMTGPYAHVFSGQISLP